MDTQAILINRIHTDSRKVNPFRVERHKHMFSELAELKGTQQKPTLSDTETKRMVELEGILRSIQQLQPENGQAADDLIRQFQSLQQ